MAEVLQVFDLQELSDRAGVTPRTVRYYIQQGLLRSPGPPGPGAKYDAGYVDRLKLIRRLQQEHLPLVEIRRRLEDLSDDDVRRLLRQPRAPGKTSAVDYVRSVLSPTGRTLAMRDQTVDAMAAPPSPSPERSQWDRMMLGPDIELHIRRPLSRAQNKIVEKIIEYARRLLEEDTP